MALTNQGNIIYLNDIPLFYANHIHEEGNPFSITMEQKHDYMNKVVKIDEYERLMKMMSTFMKENDILTSMATEIDKLLEK